MQHENFTLDMPDDSTVQVIGFDRNASYPSEIIVGYDNPTGSTFPRRDITVISNVIMYWLGISAITAPDTPHAIVWKAKQSEMSIQASFETGHFVQVRDDLNNHNALFNGDAQFKTGLLRSLFDGIRTKTYTLIPQLFPAYMRFVYDQPEPVVDQGLNGLDIILAQRNLQKRVERIEIRMGNAGLALHGLDGIDEA